MKYLLVNHIPAHPGSDAAHRKLPAAWARDLCAAGRVAKAQGITLIVATPLTKASAKARDLVDVLPDDAGFEHVTIPGYQSARAYLREHGALEAALKPLIEHVHVVQLDHGGHPMPLGLVADPIAREARKPTLWVVSGDTPPDSHLGESAGTMTKRIVGRSVDSRIRHSLHDTLDHAEAVVTTSESVSQQLKSKWSLATTPIEVADVIDAELPSQARIEHRHARLLDRDRPLRLFLWGDQIIDRGTAHALAAVHKCWKLRVPVELVLQPTGGEVEAVKRQVAELGLSIAVRWAGERETLDDADVLLDTALCNTARADLDPMIAQGLAPIAYNPRHVTPHLVALPRGDVDALADALFNAATDREALARRMLSGVDWAKTRTLDEAYRKRFAIAQSLMSESKLES